MLKKIRIVLALIFFIGITLLFLDFTGTAHAWLGWMAKVQFLPAILALNTSVIILLVVITLLFGRIYCSVICPLGIMQDSISWIAAKTSKKRRYRFSYSHAKNICRYSVLAIFIIALVAGIAVIPALIAPYSAYGRIVSSLLQPVWIAANNILATIAERADSYAFYTRDAKLHAWSTITVATVTFAILAVLAWKNGRTYCNTICPVGTVLGFLSRFSLFRIHINTDKCNGCKLCSKKCKAACINPDAHTVDYSRCVDCMDCIDTCAHNAITFSLHRREKKPAADTACDKPDAERRSFLTIAAIATAGAALKAQEKKVDGGLAIIEGKQIPKRKTPIAPPGAISLNNLAQHCTACQLCISECPNDVLRPSTNLSNLMQPEVSFETGYCRPECNQCSQVCPTGAIKPITLADKSATHVGHAVWVRANCVPLTDGVECGNCARHCPVGAIMMVPSDPNDPDSVAIPAVNEEKCIGCGACENLCPSRPLSAIYVEGHQIHRIS